MTLCLIGHSQVKQRKEKEKPQRAERIIFTTKEEDDDDDDATDGEIRVTQAKMREGNSKSKCSESVKCNLLPLTTKCLLKRPNKGSPVAVTGT